MKLRENIKKQKEKIFFYFNKEKIKESCNFSYSKFKELIKQDNQYDFEAFFKEKQLLNKKYFNKDILKVLDLYFQGSSESNMLPILFLTIELEAKNMAKYFLETSPYKELININEIFYDFKEKTALEQAINYDELEFVKLFLSFGADPNYCNKKDGIYDYIITSAIRLENKEMICLLFEYGFKLSNCLKSEKIKIEDAIIRNFSKEFLEECYSLEKKESFKNMKEPNKTKKIKL